MSLAPVVTVAVRLVALGSWLTGDGNPDGIAERAARLIRTLASGVG